MHKALVSPQLHVMTLGGHSSAWAWTCRCHGKHRNLLTEIRWTADAPVPFHIFCRNWGLHLGRAMLTCC